MLLGYLDTFSPALAPAELVSHWEVCYLDSWMNNAKYVKRAIGALDYCRNSENCASYGNYGIDAEQAYYLVRCQPTSVST